MLQTLTAPAKINLSLHIIGKRDDGYHLLESVVAFTEFGDRITIEDAPELSLSVTGPFANKAGANQGNLVLKAVRCVAAHLNETTNVAITLEKNIPVGAGLGGGSSDAASVAIALCKRWGHIVPLPTLAQWLLPLGADIPVCVHGAPLVMRGIGEEIAAASELPAWHVVLIYPNKHLATQKVYALYKKEDRASPMPQWDLPEEALQVLKASRNDLQRPAITLCPEVAEALIALETQPNTLFARMSGSGSCCFALCTRAHDAATVAEDIAHLYPNWWVQQTRLVAG